MSANFMNKKIYLSNRIRDNRELLNTLKTDQNSIYDELRYVLSQSEEEFNYSAPEVVDYCFYILKDYIEVDGNVYNENLVESGVGLGLNIYGNPIKCFKCDSPEHVQKDCGILN